MQISKETAEYFILQHLKNPHLGQEYKKDQEGFGFFFFL